MSADKIKQGINLYEEAHVAQEAAENWLNGAQLVFEELGIEANPHGVAGFLVAAAIAHHAYIVRDAADTIAKALASITSRDKS